MRLNSTLSGFFTIALFHGIATASEKDDWLARGVPSLAAHLEACVRSYPELGLPKYPIDLFAGSDRSFAADTINSSQFHQAVSEKRTTVARLSPSQLELECKSISNLAHDSEDWRKKEISMIVSFIAVAEVCEPKHPELKAFLGDPIAVLAGNERERNWAKAVMTYPGYLHDLSEWRSAMTKLSSREPDRIESQCIDLLKMQRDKAK